VVYEPGTLEVVAYKDGKAWAKDVVRTAEAPSRLEATPDRDVIAANASREQHGAFQSVRAGRDRRDRQWRPDLLRAVSVTQREAFNGLSLVIVRAKKGQTGQVHRHGIR
jgi:beta-galactosidase